MRAVETEDPSGALDEVSVGNPSRESAGSGSEPLEGAIPIAFTNDTELEMAAETDDPAGKANQSSKPASRQKSSDPGAKTSAVPGLIAFTIDTGSAQIVRVETVDASGGRRELTRDEKVSLAKQKARSTLEDIIEKTFEAGIASVLGDGSEEDELEEEATKESEEVARLRRMIIRPMIERSEAGYLMQRQVLGKAILGTLLVQETAASREEGAERRATASPRSASSSTSSRRPTPRGRPQH